MLKNKLRGIRDSCVIVALFGEGLRMRLCRCDSRFKIWNLVRTDGGNEIWESTNLSFFISFRFWIFSFLFLEKILIVWVREIWKEENWEVCNLPTKLVSWFMRLTSDAWSLSTHNMTHIFYFFVMINWFVFYCIQFCVLSNFLKGFVINAKQINVFYKNKNNQDHSFYNFWK